MRAAATTTIWVVGLLMVVAVIGYRVGGAGLAIAGCGVVLFIVGILADYGEAL